jgi:hypothetical protein
VLLHLESGFFGPCGGADRARGTSTGLGGPQSFPGVPRTQNPKLAAAQHHKKHGQPSLGTATSHCPASHLAPSFNSQLGNLLQTNNGSAQPAPAYLTRKCFPNWVLLAAGRCSPRTRRRRGRDSLRLLDNNNLTTGTPCLGGAVLGVLGCCWAAGKEDKVTSCALVWRHPLDGSQDPDPERSLNPTQPNQRIVRQFIISRGVSSSLLNSISVLPNPALKRYALAVFSRRHVL